MVTYRGRTEAAKRVPRLIQQEHPCGHLPSPTDGRCGLWVGTMAFSLASEPNPPPPPISLSTATPLNLLEVARPQQGEGQGRTEADPSTGVLHGFAETSATADGRRPRVPWLWDKNTSFQRLEFHASQCLSGLPSALKNFKLHNH